MGKIVYSRRGGKIKSPDSVAPKDHKASHQNGGSDEISVAGLSGALADAQTPSAHKASHQNGGSDEISVAGLSGDLADAQDPKAHDLGGAEHNADTLADLNAKISDADIPRIKLVAYTGDGSESQAITGVGFQPDAVIIIDDETLNAGQLNIMTGLAENSAIHKRVGNVNQYDNGLEIDADGFTVGDDGGDETPNANGDHYVAICLKGE